ncbi:MAG: branched-chain amino acid ABC transporter permease, partial [Deltaproteobacteria bacterium]|nr:branched-chain amino acid ABC transporter permease [Deltaproteobacteria bacterium]
MSQSISLRKVLLPGIILLLFLLAPYLIRDDYFLHVLIMIFYFAYMASAWNIICGYVGQLSLGHSALSGIGGYISVLLFMNLGLTPWIGMFVGGLCAMVVALIIGLPTLRLRGPYFALTTIAFAEILRIWLENTEDILGIQVMGASGLNVPLKGNSPAFFQFADKEPYYYIMLVMLSAVVLITFWMDRSRLGYYLKAIKGDQDAAEAIGIQSSKYMLIALALSAFLTALGGSFIARFLLFINPERNFGIDLSIEVALMAIVGGQGTVLGPIL